MSRPSEPALALLTPEALLARRKSAAIPPAPRPAEGLPPAVAQESLLFLSGMEGGGVAYHMPMAFRLTGRLEITALGRALDGLVARHEALRSRFLPDPAGIRVHFAPAGVGCPLTLHPDSPAEPDFAPAMARPFDTATGPLLRANLYCHAPDDHSLLLTLHHLVADGWSQGVLLNDLAELYRAAVADVAPSLPALPVQFADFAVWDRARQEAPATRPDMGFWQDQLGDAPDLTDLPLDRQRPAVQSYQGAVRWLRLPARIMQDLQTVARREKLSPFMILLAAWGVTLARLSGQEDVVVGVPLARRDRSETESMVGLLVNSLPVRLTPLPDMTVGSYLQQVRDQMLAVMEHQNTPVEHVIRHLNRPRSLSHAPLFQTMIAWQGDSRPLPVLPGLTFAPLPLPQTTAKYDLSLELRPDGDGISGGLEYATALFDPGTIDRITRLFTRILAAFTENPGLRLEDAGLPDAETRARLIALGTGAAIAPPPATGIHQLFEAHARRTPDAPAVTDPDAAPAITLSYRELDRAANRLACLLKSGGVSASGRVALCLRRGPGRIIAVLAALKCGAAYIPVDPDYPADRIAHLLSDGTPDLILTDAASRPDGAVPCLLMPDDILSGNGPDQGPETPDLSTETPAYVIYTSGSTGQPKGVVVDHGALLAITAAWADLYRLQPGDRLLQMAGFAFDVFTADILRALCTGGELVLCPPEVLMDGKNLLHRIRQEKIRFADFVPAVLAQVTEAAEREGTDIAGPLTIVCGSDRWNPADARRLRRLCRREVRLLHLYGVTEAAVDSLCHELPDTAEALTALPLGKPLANTRAHILDRAGRPVPVGVAGELCLGGRTLARGYHGRTDLTADRFIPDPVLATGRLYRTGDLARLRPDGTIEFLGRADQQIKLRGFRIEPAEIEARMREMPGIAAAAVRLWHDSRHDPHLTAWYAGSEPPAVEAVRAFLSARLPSPLVPTVFCPVRGSLPLTPNGKLDHRALPAPEETVTSLKPFEAPRTALEQTLAELWQDLFRVDRISRQDHFFELGGHSLTAVRCAAGIAARLGLEVSPTVFFEAPELHRLAARLAELTPTAGAAPAARPRPDRIPLSQAQQGLWFLSRLDGAADIYCLPMGLRLTGSTDADRLHRALNALTDRHETLRTGFRNDGDGPYQVILPPGTAFPLDRIDLTGDPAWQAQLDALSQAAATHVFDLSAPPLCRGWLIGLPDGDHILLLALHHIVADGWSMGVLAEDLSRLYAGDSPDPLPLQFADYALWQQSALTPGVLEKQTAYWRTRLSDAPVLLDLPTDRPRPTRQDRKGGLIRFTLDRETTRALEEAARTHDASLFMLLLALWGETLVRLSGSEDIVIGAPVASRSAPGLDRLIGFLVNTLAFRLELGDCRTIRDLIAATRREVLTARQHQDVPFDKVVEAVNPPRSLAHSPIFQTMLTWEGEQEPPPRLPGLTVTRHPLPHRVAKFDLLLTLRGEDGRIEGGLEFATALFDPATAERFARCFCRIAAAAARDPDLRLAEISCPDHEDQYRLLHLWQGRQTGGDDSPDVVSRFVRQADATPDAEAIVWQGAAVSYRDLDRRSNRLAHHLRMRGLSRNQPVGVCLSRSPDMIVAVLAVMKAGGACLPLDPGYPAGRLAVMLEQAAPALILTEAVTDSLLPPSSAVRIRLTADDDSLSACPDSLPEQTAGDKDIAYILYTSGSTGIPKGVAQTRRMLRNLVGWQHRQRDPGWSGPVRVLQFASLNFDVSFQEIWSALCTGDSLVLLEDGERKDLASLGLIIADRQVRRAFLPFAVLQQMAQLGVTESLNDRTVSCEIITAGEAVHVTPGLTGLLHRLGGKVFQNQYGPTETHLITQETLSCAAMADWPARPAIGHPIDNCRVYLLDRRGALAPVGSTGEIHAAGDGLAAGYYRQPELTAERFITGPAVIGAPRLYRTGDLARHGADGALHYLGRADQQVKWRGFRIEPGEIETHLRRLPGVREAAVRLREDQPGNRQLVAYIVSDRQAGELRTALKAVLPDYTVPGHWVSLARLPLTPNGKLDHRALPPPEAAADTTDGQPPRTPTEQRLAAVWQEVLSSGPVGRDDNFFDLGGHSLLATRLIHEVNRTLGVSLSLSDLFEYPTLAALSARADLQTSGTRPDHGPQPGPAPLTHDTPNRHAPFPLTDIQEAYWVGRSAGLELGGVSAHAYEELRVRDFDAARFEQALNRTIARHDALRTIFLSDGTQQVLAEVPHYVLATDDLRGCSADAVAAHLATIRERLSHQMLDAARWPVFEFRVTLLDEGISHLHISLDALTLDAASGQILARELVHFYRQPDVDLPLPEITFRDYVLAERASRQQQAYASALDYWRGRLKDLPDAPDLPLARPADSIGQPAFVRRDTRLPASCWQRLKAHAAARGITPSVLLLTAYAEILAVWSRNRRFTVTLPLFNRQPLHPDVNRLMGDFTSVILLEATPDPQAGFEQNARRIQAQLWRDMSHAAVSGVQVVRELARMRGDGKTLFPIVFNSTLIEMSGGGEDITLTGALQAERLHTITQTPQVWIDHTVVEWDGALLFNWDSIDALFPDGMAGAMFDAYSGLLGALEDEAAWQRPTAALIPFRHDFPPAAPALADGPLLHDLFDRQARRNPDATAVISGSRCLTYGDIRARARAAAAALQQQGHGPGDIVAIVMQPGWEQTVAVLAVHYAGGVYLPLDPALPEARLAHILERTGTRIALVQSWDGAAEKLPPAVRVLPIDRLTATGEPVPVSRRWSDPAYVIFTSGSTGTPKGVVIDHRGAVNTIEDINRRYSVGPDDRVFAVSALSFDLSVYDIFGTLAAGACLITPTPEAARDPADWLTLLRRHGVTLWNSAPALMGLLVEEAEGSGIHPDGLRVVMLSGDWIPITLPDRIRRVAPAAALYSLGGATEASIWSIEHPITHVPPDARSIPYGKALDRQQFHVLDEGLDRCPVWVPGELHIGGVGLAQGYWRDPEQTAARFITHPVTGDRLYRTGDMGRLLPDGTIEFLGRIDTQVKIQGYRIELGEIESTLQQHPAVRAAVVAVREDIPGSRRLAAYIVPDGTRPDPAALLGWLADRVPPYMVPASLDVLDSLPLSPNGKLDRKALPPPRSAGTPAPTATGTAPGATDRRSAEIIALIEASLSLSGLTPQDNLLVLGATSIDIVRLNNALAKATGIRLPLARLMASPTVGTILDLCRDLPAAAPAAAAASLAPIDDPEARRAFKERDPGLRRFTDGTPGLPLSRQTDDAGTDLYNAYRSVRDYRADPVTGEQLAGLLACLRRNPAADAPRHLYASAGGLYPLQTYLYLKPGRVTGIPAGAYYYDPRSHHLIPTGNGRELPSDAYDYFVNRPIFEAAAFALFLIAERAAMEPLYGEKTLDFCHIEAGSAAQLLTMRAASLDLGLCGIGSAAPGHLGPLFALGPTHQPIYSMVGGLRADPSPAPARLEQIAAAPDLEVIEL